MISSRTLTPANQITLLRLAFAPLFAILVVGRSYRGALAVLIAAALSDGLDGLVARIYHQETLLGIALDPIADKILMTTAYISLSARHVLPWWLTILVLMRDLAILITALLISIVAGYRPFRPTFLGKSSTVAQLLAILAAVSFKAGVGFVSLYVLKGCIYLAAALTTGSGLHYLLVARSLAGAPKASGLTDEPATPPGGKE